MEKEILSFVEFCEFCSISTSTGNKVIQRKELPYYKPKNGKVYFKLEDVRNYILQGRVSSASEVVKKRRIMIFMGFLIRQGVIEMFSQLFLFGLP